MFSLITLPNPVDIVTSSTAWVTAFLPEFYVLIYAAVGILVFGLIVRWVIKKVNGGVKSAFGMRGRRGGRRRR